MRRIGQRIQTLDSYPGVRAGHAQNLKYLGFLWRLQSHAIRDGNNLDKPKGMDRERVGSHPKTLEPPPEATMQQYCPRDGSHQPADVESAANAVQAVIAQITAGRCGSAASREVNTEGAGEVVGSIPKTVDPRPMS